MVAAPAITVCGERVLLDTSGAVYWPRTQTLIVADLHFEKASSFARGGTFLPPYDTLKTLRDLARAAKRFEAKRIVALGDSFHDAKAGERVLENEKSAFAAFDQDFVWIRGNHDPELPDWVTGLVTEEMADAPFLFRHEPQPAPAPGEMAGHLHPVAIVRIKGRRFRRRAFISDGTRIVLPAFGALTGGLDVLDPAFQPVFPGPFHAFMIGRQTIVPVKSADLSAEAA